MEPMQKPSFWSTRSSWVLLGFLGIAGYFLITEHRAHVIAVLPWLFLLACPLMHLFMHGGHGTHGGHHGHAAPEDNKTTATWDDR